MASKKDYYDILGVSKGSSEDEIKKAYKKLARAHHPDMVAEPDKKDAERRFKEINEAYQVLKDPQKRKMYDQFGHAGMGAGASGGASGFGGFGGFGGGRNQGQWGPFSYSANGANVEFDPFDIFEEFFGFRGFRGQKKTKKGKNLFYEMHIDFIDAVRGVEKEIAVESGKVKIKIPQGVRHGTEMKFSGKGMPGASKDIPNGDLFITFRVPTPREFTQRAGDDFGTVVEIDFVQAILGDTIEVAVVDENAKNGIGSAKLKIPKGTQSGTQFRVRGKGMPRLQGHGAGNVIVQVIVKIPSRVSRKQRGLLEKYRKL